jgi:DNA-directed RNA polymerase subunit RPC12/RpoP
MKHGLIRKCATCQKPYWFVSGGGGPMQDFEDYECPNCGAHEGREKTGGVPQTSKLTAEQEMEWAAKQGR